jgi:hypothetical protein
VAGQTEQHDIGWVEVGATVSALPDVVTDKLDGAAVIIMGLAAPLALSTALSDKAGSQLHPRL